MARVFSTDNHGLKLATNKSGPMITDFGKDRVARWFVQIGYMFVVLLLVSLLWFIGSFLDYQIEKHVYSHAPIIVTWIDYDYFCSVTAMNLLPHHLVLF